MEALLEKISSYDLVNNFLSGVCFCVFINEFTVWNFDIENEIMLICLFYFVGIIVSRVGSLLIEKILTNLPYFKVTKTSNSDNNIKLEFEKFLIFAPYDEFLLAEKIDSKITTLSATNNVYRSMVSVCFCTIVAKIYELTLHNVASVMWNGKFEIISGVFLLMIFFAFAYRKQTSYVVKRVKNAIKNQEDK